MMMRRRTLLAASAAGAAAAAASGVLAPTPAWAKDDEVLLTLVDGDRKLTWTESQFLALPTERIVTSTVWTPKRTFEGPNFAGFLDASKVRRDKVRLYALDDYSSVVDVEYARRTGAILAHSQDGVRFSRKDFGPLFLMYPRDAMPELRTAAATANFVWAVIKIEGL